MPRGTLEVILIGAKGLHDTDFFSKYFKYNVYFNNLDYQIDEWILNFFLGLLKLIYILCIYFFLWSRENGSLCDSDI